MFPGQAWEALLSEPFFTLAFKARALGLFAHTLMNAVGSSKEF